MTTGDGVNRSNAVRGRLRGIAMAVGDRIEIDIFGGVPSGADGVAAVALGARAMLVGRAYLYGRMSGGKPGVELAGELLRMELARTMQLLGVIASRTSDPNAFGFANTQEGIPPSFPLYERCGHFVLARDSHSINLRTRSRRSRHARPVSSWPAHL
jgi:hypothetical protein